MLRKTIAAVGIVLVLTALFYWMVITAEKNYKEQRTEMQRYCEVYGGEVCKNQ